MTELYVPKPGERVRVVAVSREDPLPMHRLGDVATVRKATMSIVAGYLFLYEDGVGGTWCRVEPVVCTCPHDGPDPLCVEHAPDNDERTCDSCRAGAHGPLPEVPCQLVETTHGPMWLCETCAEEACDRVRRARETGLYDLGHPRRFCACGQELWSTEQRAGGMCGDCGNRVVGQRPKTIPLDARIRAAQPETEEHAFERPGYSWP